MCIRDSTPCDRGNFFSNIFLTNFEFISLTEFRQEKWVSTRYTLSTIKRSHHMKVFWILVLVVRFLNRSKIHIAVQNFQHTVVKSSWKLFFRITSTNLQWIVSSLEQYRVSLWSCGVLRWIIQVRYQPKLTTQYWSWNQNRRVTVLHWLL